MAKVIKYGAKSPSVYQRLHMDGKFDVHAPIKQSNGRADLPPLSKQWRADAQRRFGNAEATSQRPSNR